MSGYIRQDVTNNIADGNVINASDFDNEYNAIEAAFHASTGHTHDGTAAEGAPITKIGPTQDVVASASALTPKTDNTVDLGSSTLEYKDLWIDGTANIDSLVADTADINAGTIDGVTIGGAVRGAGSFTTLNANGNTTLGDAVGDTVTINGTATFVNANPTLSAGTANGVLYLDGSKVATSGSALTFDGTNLATTGGVRLDNAQYYYGKNAAGSAVRLLGVNAGNVNYVGAIDSGPTEVNYGAATTITTQYWNISGSEQMRLTSTGLGIGTSSPGAKLGVFGDTYVIPTSAASTNGVYFRNATNATTFAQVAYNANNGELSVGTTQAYSLLLTTNNTTKATLDSSGNLGLGVTPSAWGGVLSKALEFSNGCYVTAYNTSGNESIYMGANNYYNGSNYIYKNTRQATQYQQVEGKHLWYTAPSGTAGNAISFTQAMTLSGTSTPSLRVGVTADLAGFSFQAANQVGFSVHNSGSSATAAYFSAANNVSLSSAGNFAVINGTDGILFGAASTERMRLDSSGNLGLGVTPSAWTSYKALQISTGASLASTANQMVLGSNWSFDGSDRYVISDFSTLYIQNSGQHKWFTAPSGTAGNTISFTQAMTLDASGNLGVGTSSTIIAANTTNVQIYGSSTANLRLQNGTSGVTSSDGFLLQSAGNDVYVWNLENSFLSFGTNNQERARITSGGYFKASNNGTYASSAGSLHELKGNPDDNVLRVENYQATLTGAIAGVRISYSAATPNTTTRSFIYCDDSTTLRAEIRSNGGLANYQSNNVDLSDSRTKKDIAPAASMWSKIGALEIVTYKYNDQTHDDVNVGVIAQQVEQVEPVWVDSDGFGETPEDGVPLKTVYTKDITFAAIKALQEAMTRIEQLEARVAALEAA